MRREHVVLPLGELERAGRRAAIDRALRDTPGVMWSLVNDAMEMAYVEYDPDMIDVARLAAIADAAGRERSERVEYPTPAPARPRALGGPS